MSKLKYSLDIQHFAEGDEQEDKTKAALDKATKEAAEWKRKYNEKLSDEEKQKEAAEEQQKRFNDINAKLVRAETVSSLIDGGYDKATAESIADAMASGDHMKVAEALTTFHKNLSTAHQKALDDAKLQNAPVPNGGTGGNSEPTKESFGKMTLDEKVRLKNENLELYKKLKN